MNSVKLTRHDFIVRFFAFVAIFISSLWSGKARGILSPQTAEAKQAPKRKKKTPQPKGKKKRKPKKGKKNGGKRKPNFVVINLDDISSLEMKQGLPQTFAFFSRMGMIFENFICENPQCGPSRATLLTGKSSDRTGILHNRQVRRGPKGHSFATKLKGLGYITYLLGKDINGLRGKLPGWVKYDTTSGGKGKKVRGEYVTKYYTSEAVKFIKQTNKPFCLYLAPHIPHEPFVSDSKHNGKFKNFTASHGRPAFNEADVSDKPSMIRKLPLLSVVQMNRIARERRQMLVSCDQMIKKLIRELEKQGKLANTVIFIIGDNGFLLGSHRCVTKGKPYDESVRVTMMVMGPGIGKGRSKKIVAMQDIAVTMGHIAGFRIPGANGRDLRPGKSQDRPHVLIQHDREWRGLWSPEFTYVEHSTGEREYYDRVSDPGEMNNLLADWEGHTPQLPQDRQDQLHALLAAA